MERNAVLFAVVYTYLEAIDAKAIYNLTSTQNLFVSEAMLMQ